MRCFVGCWPDPATRERLDRLARDAHVLHPAARRIAGCNLHLTVAFIGELAPDHALGLAGAIAGEAISPFAWRIDRTGRFDRARVLWAGGPDEPALTELAERVRARLRALQIRFDEKPFAAHVTLLRDMPLRPAAEEPARERTEPIEPFVWVIDGARLLVSEREARGATHYRVLEAT